MLLKELMLKKCHFFKSPTTLFVQNTLAFSMRVVIWLKVVNSKICEPKR